MDTSESEDKFLVKVTIPKIVREDGSCGDCPFLAQSYSNKIKCVLGLAVIHEAFKSPASGISYPSVSCPRYRDSQRILNK